MATANLSFNTTTGALTAASVTIGTSSKHAPKEQTACADNSGSDRGAATFAAAPSCCLGTASGGPGGRLLSQRAAHHAGREGRPLLRGLLRASRWPSPHLHALHRELPAGDGEVDPGTAHLGDRMGKDVFFYSISIDPKNDTPER